MPDAKFKITPYQLPFMKPFITAEHQISHRNGYWINLEIKEERFYAELSPLPSFSKESLAEAIEQFHYTKEEFLMRMQHQPDVFYEWLHPLKLFASVEWVFSVLYEQYIAFKDAQPYGFRQKLNLFDSTVPINAVLGIASLEESEILIKKNYAQGIRVFKCKASEAHLQELIPLLAQLMGVFPDIQFRLDANGQWNPKNIHAITAELKSKHLPIEYIEQPLFPCSVNEFRLLQSLSLIDLAADEMLADAESASELIDKGAARVLVVKPGLVGSFQRNINLIHRATTHDIKVVISTLLDSAMNRELYALLAAYANYLSGDSERAHGLSTGSLLKEDYTGPFILEKYS